MRIEGNRTSATSLGGASGTPLLRGTIGDRSLVRFGSEGDEVKKLQEALKRAGLFEGEASGRFDRDTFRAVRAYQEQNGLQVDGVVGQQTWGAMLGQSYPPGVDMLSSAGSAGVSGPGASGRSSFESAGPVSQAGSATGYVNGSATNIDLANIGDGETMRTDAARAFKAMQEAARRDGVDLSATSGFRSMAEQERLYQMYRNGTGNLAARPGFSNHQGGVSIDIGGVNGYGTAAYNWLQSNASQYGFRNDVAGEYWHWTFGG